MKFMQQGAAYLLKIILLISVSQTVNAEQAIFNEKKTLNVICNNGAAKLQRTTNRFIIYKAIHIKKVPVTCNEAGYVFNKKLLTNREFSELLRNSEVYKNG